MMKKINEILLASSNEGKIKEIRQLFRSTNISLMTLQGKIKKHLEKGYPIEKGKTFRENACLKAESIGKRTGMFTLADDSGLMIEILQGYPGVLSARIAATDEERVRIVLDRIKNVQEPYRTATFVTVAALYDPNEDRTYTFEGEVKGRITAKPIGKQGFTYDPIFFSVELGKTFAQATTEEKNRVSHRARAMEKVLKFLKNDTD